MSRELLLESTGGGPFRIRACLGLDVGQNGSGETVVRVTDIPDHVDDYDVAARMNVLGDTSGGYTIPYSALGARSEEGGRR